MPPIELLVEEMDRSYKRTSHVTKEEERRRTISRWQQRLDASADGRWTYRLITNISSWYDRQHDQVDFYLSELLTGHRCFRAYQYRFKLDHTAQCRECQTLAGTVEHVIFSCHRFERERRELEYLCETPLTPENLVGCMLRSEEYWGALKKFAAVVLEKLRTEERARRDLG